MTRSAMVEAVRKLLPGCFACREMECHGETPPCDVCADRIERIASAVLAAADGAEPVGPWHICGITAPEMGIDTYWWDVQVPGDKTATRYRFDTEAEARAVANTLNRLAALAVRP